jgi:hypothetical protein
MGLSLSNPGKAAKSGHRGLSRTKLAIKCAALGDFLALKIGQNILKSSVYTSALTLRAEGEAKVVSERASIEMVQVTYEQAAVFRLFSRKTR